MAGEFSHVFAVRRAQTTNELEAQRLVAQLAQLRALRAEEKQLRARVAFLEKQAVVQGPLHREVELALTLEHEQTQLQQLRAELAAQEEELAAPEGVLVDETAQLKAQRLEERLSDLKARREQARLHQGNVLYLEEKLALLGADARLDMVNELKLSREELQRVERKLQSLQTQLLVEWQLTLADLPDLEEMDESQIGEFARRVASKIEELSREAFVRLQTEMIQRLDEFVSPLLEELRAFTYGLLPRPIAEPPLAELKAVRSDQARFTLDPGGELRRTQPPWQLERKVRWRLGLPGTRADVAVILDFDHHGHPQCFQCVLFNNDGRIQAQTSAGLDRGALRDALQRLLGVGRHWWEFWKAPRILPESWA